MGKKAKASIPATVTEESGIVKGQKQGGSDVTPDQLTMPTEGVIEHNNVAHKSKATVARENELEWVDITCSTMKTGRTSWAGEMENFDGSACRKNKATEVVVELQVVVIEEDNDVVEHQVVSMKGKDVAEGVVVVNTDMPQAADLANNTRFTHVQNKGARWRNANYGRGRGQGQQGKQTQPSTSKGNQNAFHTLGEGVEEATKAGQTGGDICAPLRSWLRCSVGM
ncbi:hypothetical protein K7X08_021390 [Anisodus acutangulus]|uniref:Uncharacterized protein n=1 Tax=Anisodus acutangulus TaxID=402998 RepID=A0A9Q1M222_9SOLA|nr:hypothetical protein K7X08_021390 [Anisodus acutangulus]